MEEHFDSEAPLPTSLVSLDFFQNTAQIPAAPVAAQTAAYNELLHSSRAAV